MKTKNYTDGKKRATLKIEVAVSLDELAQYFVGLYMDDSVVDKAKTLSKKHILNNVRDEIRVSGTEMSGYSFVDNNLSEAMDEVIEIFGERFPELL